MGNRIAIPIKSPICNPSSIEREGIIIANRTPKLEQKLILIIMDLLILVDDEETQPVTEHQPDYDVFLVSVHQPNQGKVA